MVFLGYYISTKTILHPKRPINCETNLLLQLAKKRMALSLIVDENFVDFMYKGLRVR